MGYVFPTSGHGIRIIEELSPGPSGQYCLCKGNTTGSRPFVHGCFHAMTAELSSCDRIWTTKLKISTGWPITEQVRWLLGYLRMASPFGGINVTSFSEETYVGPVHSPISLGSASTQRTWITQEKPPGSGFGIKRNTVSFPCYLNSLKSSF